MGRGAMVETSLLNLVIILYYRLWTHNKWSIPSTTREKSLENPLFSPKSARPKPPHPITKYLWGEPVESTTSTTYSRSRTRRSSGWRCISKSRDSDNYDSGSVTRYNWRWQPWTDGIKSKWRNFKRYHFCYSVREEHRQPDR